MSNTKQNLTDKDEVRTSFDGFSKEIVPDALMDKAISRASNYVRFKLSQCGVVLGPCIPDIVRDVTADMAALWLLTRPLFANCADKLPERVAFLQSSVAGFFEDICKEGAVLEGALPSGGVLVAENNEGRIAAFPGYSEPVSGERKPIIHPDIGPGSAYRLGRFPESPDGDLWW